jgi:hypothetical protein
MSCVSPWAKIETNPPQCSGLSYSPSVWTNGGVTASATCVDDYYDWYSDCATSGGSTSVGSNGVGAITFQDLAGNTGGCAAVVTWVDKVGPDFSTAIYDPFAAKHDKEISLTFVDQSSPGSGGTAGLGQVTAELTSPSGRQWTESGHGGGASPYVFGFVGDYSEAGDYDMRLTYCDNATGGNASATGNCVTTDLPKYFHVVADVPVWDSTTASGGYRNCTKDWHSVCPSRIVYSTASAALATVYTAGNNADGSKAAVADATAGERQVTEVQLSDKYGNPVVTETNLKQVRLQYVWDNTVRLDQVAGTGDAVAWAAYTSSETTPAVTLDAQISGAPRTVLPSSTTWLSETGASYPYASPLDGHYRLDARSYAPTSAGYTPLATPPHNNQNLKLAAVRYEVIGVPGLGLTGSALEVATAGSPALKYAPMVVAQIEAMNPDAAGGYTASTAARNNITLNEDKRFQVAYSNVSTSAKAAAPHLLGLVLDATSPNVTWMSGALERLKIDSADKAPAASEVNLKLDTDGTKFDALWNTIVSVTEIKPNSTSNPTLRLRAMPKLANTTKAPSTGTEARTYVGYTLNGKAVRYKGELIGGEIACGNGKIDPGESCSTCEVDVGICECPVTDPLCKPKDEGGSDDPIKTCSDNIDNNDNGATDCADTACQTNPLVTFCNKDENTNKLCSDGIDNNGNGPLDCAESTCTMTSFCDGEICGNGIDDNGNGKADCLDAACQTQLACQPTCGNGRLDDGETCATCPVDLPACGVVANATIDITGIVRSSGGVYTNNPLNNLNQDVGDMVDKETANAINRNTATYIKDVKTKRCEGQTMYELTGTNEDKTLFDGAATTCSSSDGQVTFFDFTGVSGTGSVYLKGGTGSLTLPKGRHTILIRGGDLHIQSSLLYPSGDSESALGLIVLPDAEGKGGNVYIYPEVTNLVGALYAEGGVMSVSSAGIPDEYVDWAGDGRCAADGSDGICDRNTNLKNQLYWKGLLASWNTIGGSDKAEPACPKRLENTCLTQLNADLQRITGLPDTHPEKAIYQNDPAAWEAKHNAAIARRYDLLYWRKFTANSGGKRATEPAPPSGAKNNHALIIEYDGRFSATPPPLFSLGEGAAGTETPN